MVPIDLLSIASTHLGSTKRGKYPTLPPLNRGEVVEAKVVSALSPDRAILLVKGRQLLARTPVPLKADSVILLNVEQVVPECVLRLLQGRLGQPDGLASLIRVSDLQRNAYQCLIDLIAPLTTSSRVHSKQRLPEILRHMANVVRRMSLSSERLPDRHFLGSVLDSSGVLWENKLKSLLLNGIRDKNQVQALVRQDLKGLALGAMEDSSVVRLVSSEGLGRFVDALEQFQLANLVGLEEKGKFLLMIPMQWADVFRFAQILIDLPAKNDEKRGEQEEPLTVSLFLEMSHLGPIRIESSVHETSIRICFLVCSEQVQVLLNSFVDELKNQLERHGFSVQQITCRVEERGVLEKTSFVDALVDFEEHRVSVMV